MENKWWLISDKDVKAVEKALEEAGMEDALHTLVTGLNTTDEVPDDWK